MVRYELFLQIEYAHSGVPNLPPEVQVLPYNARGNTLATAALGLPLSRNATYFPHHLSYNRNAPPSKIITVTNRPVYSRTVSFLPSIS